MKKMKEEKREAHLGGESVMEEELPRADRGRGRGVAGEAWVGEAGAARRTWVGEAAAAVGEVGAARHGRKMPCAKASGGFHYRARRRDM
jgi:hypothetical protein